MFVRAFKYSLVKSQISTCEAEKRDVKDGAENEGSLKSRNDINKLEHVLDETINPNEHEVTDSTEKNVGDSDTNDEAQKQANDGEKHTGHACLKRKFLMLLYDLIQLQDKKLQQEREERMCQKCSLQQQQEAIHSP